MQLTLKLLEQAYFNNGAGESWKDTAYIARAEVNGIPCKVYWQNINPDAEDESDCCNWEKPYLIEFESNIIDPDEHEIEILHG